MRGADGGTPHMRNHRPPEARENTEFFISLAGLRQLPPEQSAALSGYNEKRTPDDPHYMFRSPTASGLRMECLL